MMERLTTWRKDNRAAIANNDGANPTQQMMKIPTVITRLAQIEDILGEEYDIGRLKDILEAYKNGRCVFYQPGYSPISHYYKDEDGLYIREVSGVVSEEEYMIALKVEQNEIS